MKTSILASTDENIELVGKALLDGKLVGIPTETVYGLAANALNGNAVKSIFIVKGRPQDNPLIIHISKKEDAIKYVESISEDAYALMEKFWPGPLTIVLKAKKIIPKEVTAGLDTVAVRCPENLIARKIIDSAGVPLAAPSANTSGKPSTTTAQHVFHDLNGKIPYIIDGGSCDIGVESTIINMSGNKPMLLRPGKISREEIETIIGKIDLSPAIFEKMSDDFKAQAPGMKYRHYAPNADVIIIDGADDDVIKYISLNAGDKDGIICFNGEKSFFTKGIVFEMGDRDNPVSLSHNLFDILRRFDELGVKKIYSRKCESTGKYLGVYNRLTKAAGFNIKKV